MIKGVGGSTYDQALDRLSDMSGDVPSITTTEFHQRREKAQILMEKNHLEAIYVHAGTNFYYYTGAFLYAFERMAGAILTADGRLEYLIPAFEIDSLEESWAVEAPVNGWQEHESPHELFRKTLHKLGITNGKIGLDENTPFFVVDGLRQAAPEFDYVNAKPVTAGCRMQKSPSELALIQRAMDMTIEVHKAAASILHEGITASTVKDFIHEAHKRVGAPGGATFALVLFGKNTAIPHGVSSEQTLQQGDMVLIDMGCTFKGYNSDITRSYVFGEPTDHHRKVWNQEKATQAEVFAAAELGKPCGDLDRVMRTAIEREGYGPGYDLPGVPHRVGHGIGLDVHEWPYLVQSDTTPLDVGMCFSNEPTLALPGQFGIRLEDHFYMTAQGPKWFTEPSKSFDDPFGT